MRWPLKIGCFVVPLVVLLARAATGREQRTPAETALPPAVEKVVRAHRPKAAIDKVTVETQAGTNLYDIEFKDDQGEMEVAEDGTIIDIVSIVGMKDLPGPAAETIKKIVGEAGATIRRLEKAEVYSEVAEGRIVGLPQRKHVYEAELDKNGRTGEVTVAADGTVVEALKWDESERGGSSGRVTATGRLPEIRHSPIQPFKPSKS